MSPIKTGYLVIANAAMSFFWLRCFVAAASALVGGGKCELSQLHPHVLWAIGIGCLEVVNAGLGLTRQNILSVIMFVGARAFVGVYLPPISGCTLPFLLTAATWGAGETVRFACFAGDSLSPSPALKTVRYNAGPIFFPIGVLGEWLMLFSAAQQPGLACVWALVAIWPAGFVVLMRQLLAQRAKHMGKVKGN